MDDRKRRTKEARARLADDAPAAWKDYRLAQMRRLENMQQLGWVESEHIRYDSRATLANSDNARRVAVELLKLSPDVVLATGSLNVEAMQRASQTLPIVFVGLTDPVGAGLVESLARPGGSTTGFASFEYGLSIKWLELLKEITPGVTRVGVVRQQGNSTGIGMWAAMQVAAPSFNMELRPIDAVALARRLAVIMHRIWVDGTEFRWTREQAAAAA